MSRPCGRCFKVENGKASAQAPGESRVVSSLGRGGGGGGDAVSSMAFELFQGLVSPHSVS